MSSKDSTQHRVTVKIDLDASKKFPNALGDTKADIHD